MIILVSPTKQMAPSLPAGLRIKSTDPQFTKHAKKINGVLSTYTPESLQELMKISPDLAQGVNERITEFEKGGESTTPAIFSYTGTVFKEMDPHSFSSDELNYAHNHLRILSGYYGLVRPLDGIKPYRLEMKTPLSVDGSKNLYDYWKGRINQVLTSDEFSKDIPVLNLASLEYFKMIKKKQYPAGIITISFKDAGPKGPRVVGMYAKMARGRLLKRIIKEQVEYPDEIRGWNIEGYLLNDDLSSRNEWVFFRS